MEPIIKWLTQLSHSIWHSEEVPKDWRKQLVIPLHKKGTYDDCDNFRGIALLSVPGKVFCRVIQCRLKGKANQMLRENQCGFRKGRGCADQLFSLRMLMERAREFHKPHTHTHTQAHTRTHTHTHCRLYGSLPCGDRVISILWRCQMCSCITNAACVQNVNYHCTG